MKRSASIRTIGISSVALVLTLAFSLIFFMPKAHAQGKYFNSYYIGFNLGVIKASDSGSPTLSGGTDNLSFGKNINIDNIVIGGDVALGYSDNGSYTEDNFDGYGDNVTSKISSTYFAAALKAGYVFKKVMPFVKLGYIGERYKLKGSVAGPYSSSYSSASISKTGNGILYGAGVEYMFNRTWGVIAQYSGTSMSIDSSNVKTNAYTLGVNYNF
ncbi:MAG TPA: porin family protein [Ignavibacteria bacterium]|nr:porin family protein [Ignavibacteria bacterium]